MAKTRIDRRVSGTRALLHEALMSLIAEKGYEPITISEICERASVGRSTFYAHYAGKDDLMRSGVNHSRNFALGREMEGSAQAGLKGGGLAFSLMMLEQARDHFHLHEMLGDRGRDIVIDTVRQVLSDLVRSQLAAASRKSPKEVVPREFVVQYVVGAYMAVVTWWLDGGARLPPQQVDVMFRRLVTEGLACLH